MQFLAGPSLSILLQIYFADRSACKDNLLSVLNLTLLMVLVCFYVSQFPYIQVHVSLISYTVLYCTCRFIQSFIYVPADYALLSVVNISAVQFCEFWIKGPKWPIVMHLQCEIALI